MRILVPSIVDPSLERGGAWTATRGLVELIRSGPARAEVDVVPLPLRSPLRHHVRRLRSVVGSLASPLPAKALFARDPAWLRELRARFAEQRCELVLVNGADLLWLLPELPDDVPAALVAHNLEHELYAAQVERVVRRWPAARRLLERDLARLRDYELGGMRAIGSVVFLSSADEAAAKRAIPALRSLVVPPVFDAPRRPRARPEGRQGLHVGMMANFGWWPNRDGLRWFAERVLPSVRDRVTLHLFGPDSDRAAPGIRDAVRHGFVSAPGVAYDACDLMICPIVSGGGVCVKVAEAVYHRMPVLSTPFGARGLPLRPDPGIVVLDRPDDWAGFLASADALRLREHDIASCCADAFAAASHVAALDAFLAGATPRRDGAHVPRPPRDRVAAPGDERRPRGTDAAARARSPIVNDPHAR